jgi:hypothetical protein
MIDFSRVARRARRLNGILRGLMPRAGLPSFFSL